MDLESPPNWGKGGRDGGKEANNRIGRLSERDLDGRKEGMGERRENR